MSTHTYYWIGGKAHIARRAEEDSTFDYRDSLCGRIFPAWSLWTARSIRSLPDDIQVCKTCLRLAAKEKET